MLNWDLIAAKLSESRPEHTGPFRVGIYSRMTMVYGQESVAETHIKWMQMAVRRDSRFSVHKVYQDFGVNTEDALRMACYQRLMEDCLNGKVDLVMAYDLSRIGESYNAVMKNVEPLVDLESDAGVVFLGDKLFFLADQAQNWAKNMARGDYSSCQLPYFVGRMPKDEKK